MTKVEVQPISLAIAMKEMYKVSNLYVYLTYATQFLFFITNLYVIVFQPKESNGLIWGLVSAAIAIIIINFYFLRQSKTFYELGESIRKLDMIERIFPNALNKTQKSYLISKIPSRILEKSQNNAEIKTDYYTNEQSQHGMLIQNIQQNCYFTSEIMRNYARVILYFIIIIVIALGCSVFYGFFLLSENTTNNEISKNFSSYISLLVNFIFAMNIIDHYFLFNKKAKELEKIDLDLDRMKNNPLEDEVITSFTEYNCILCDALPCPEYVYNWNKLKLNTVWENRLKK